MPKGESQGLFLRQVPGRDAFGRGTGGMLFHGLQVFGVLVFGKEPLVSLQLSLHKFRCSFVFLFPAFDGNIKIKLFPFHRQYSEYGVGF
jgi:hypothetical protein